MAGIYATYPGIDQIESASFTLCHGAAPSSGVITILPQDGQIPQTGTLTLGNDSESVSFADCLLSKPTMQAGSGGTKISFTVYDRRWRWQFKSITGRYNTRSKANPVDVQFGTTKTPQELATLLFEALGESNFDVSKLPNYARPEVEWFEDNPAEELEELAESLGCRIVPKMGDKFALEPLGQGQDIPPDMLMAEGRGFDPEPIPEKLRIVTGPVLFQMRFALEAVGKDTDGKIKKIDDLSYAPAAGWEKESPYALLADETDEKIRALVEETVFKWYRIVEPIEVPKNEKTTKRADILPVFDKLIDEEEDDDGVKVPLKAKVDGKFFDDEGLNDADATTYIEVKEGWSLDGDRGIVQFNKFKVKIDDVSGEVTPAAMRLICTFNCRETESKDMVRYIYNRPLSKGIPNTGAKIEKKDDLIPTVKEDYDSNGNVQQPPIDNLSELDQEINYYLDAIEAGLEPDTVSDGEYPGIRQIEPDGAIQQVSWEVVSGQGAKTRASRNSEHDLTVPSYGEAKAANMRRFIQSMTVDQKRTKRQRGFF